MCARLRAVERLAQQYTQSRITQIDGCARKYSGALSCTHERNIGYFVHDCAHIWTAAYMHVGADNKRVLTKAKTLMAEDTRFELVRLLHQHAFQACAIDH